MRRHIVAVVIIAAVQAAAVFAQVGGWSILEHRTETVEAVLRQFKADWLEAKDVLAPDVGAHIEFPDGALYVEEKRSVARTGWIGNYRPVPWNGSEFVTQVDWRELMALPEERRRHVAVHEVCHLIDGERLKVTELSVDERHRLEMRAERCVIVYLATRGAVGQ